jgi:hypothetical protein
MVITVDGEKIEENFPIVKKATVGNYNTGYSEGQISITEPPEISEVIKEVFADKIDVDTSMSSMDMKANMHAVEAVSVNIFDALVSFHFLPQSALPLSRQKKRLSLSVDGKGIDSAVEIATAGIERKGGAGFLERVKNVFVPSK